MNLHTFEDIQVFGGSESRNNSDFSVHMIFIFERQPFLWPTHIMGDASHRAVVIHRVRPSLMLQETLPMTQHTADVSKTFGRKIKMVVQFSEEKV